MTISIDSIDEDNSKPSSSQPHYVAALSDKLDQTRINNLGSLIQRSKNAEVMNVRVELHPGNILSFDTKAGIDLEGAVTTINGWLKQISGAEDEFKQKIRDVNEKLKSRKDLDKP